MLLHKNYILPSIVYYYKYSITLGSKNKCIIMNFIDDGTDEVEYEKINITIIDGDFTNISLIIYKGNYYAIDAYDTSCHGY